jgi:hypothetical protein
MPVQERMVFLQQRGGRWNTPAIMEVDNKFLFHGLCQAGKTFSIIIGMLYPPELIFRRLVSNGTNNN